jgi:transposase-like protein
MRYEELDDTAATVYEGIEEEAVRLVQTSGRTQREIAGDLGTGLSTLVRWIGRSRDRRAVDPTAAAEGDVTDGAETAAPGVTRSSARSGTS